MSWLSPRLISCSLRTGPHGCPDGSDVTTLQSHSRFPTLLSQSTPRRLGSVAHASFFVLPQCLPTHWLILGFISGPFLLSLNTPHHPHPTPLPTHTVTYMWFAVSSSPVSGQLNWPLIKLTINDVIFHFHLIFFPP